MPLVNAFFERDLSEAEAEELDALIASSPEAAERLSALAERDYLASGLPGPRWGDGRPKRRLGAWLLGALFLAGGGIALALQESRLNVVHAGADDGAYEAVEAAGETVEEESFRPLKRLELPAREDEPATAQRRFGMKVDNAREGKMQVKVFDRQGRCVSHVYDGPLNAGAQTLAWDGLMDNGVKAPPGRYVMEVLSPAGASRQELQVR